MIARNSAGTVVLIHGLGRSSASMRVLAMRLRREGFDTVLLDYPSRHASLAEASAIAGERIAQVTAARGPVHLVGHSLGGILALRLKLSRPDLPIGRVVQLGSPNLGSGAARNLRESAMARRVFGPVLDDLAGEPGAIAEAHDDIAAVAGTGFPSGLARRYDVEGPNDGLVAQRSAWGRAAAHRLSLPGLHTWLPLSGAAARATIRFLKTGEVENVV